MNRLELGKDEKYNHLMNFNEDVLKLEFEKAERMLKKTDRLIEKYKDKSSPPKKLTVKFALPDQWRISVNIPNINNVILIIYNNCQ